MFEKQIEIIDDILLEDAHFSANIPLLHCIAQNHDIPDEYYQSLRNVAIKTEERLISLQNLIKNVENTLQSTPVPYFPFLHKRIDILQSTNETQAKILSKLTQKRI